MNTTKQFWALFKFQFTANPFVLVAPVVMIIPLTTNWITRDFHPSLNTLLMNSSSFIYSVIIFMILAPEIFQRSGSVYASGTELLLTRAVDRPIVYRSKTFLLFLIVPLLPLLFVFQSSRQPDLKISEYSKATQHYYLESLSGSTLSTEGKVSIPVISIPRGNILLKEWLFWTALAMLTTIQLLLAAVYPFKYRAYLLWAVYFGFIFLPLLSVFPLLSKSNRPPVNVEFFLFFASHQILFWAVTGVVFVLTQLWCERRFCRFEF